MDLKDLLKSFREKQKLTQQELANKSGLSRNSISNYERGDRIPKVDDLKKIADALDIQLTDLMENKTSNSTVGENIKIARKEKGLTQKELALAIGLTPPTITRYEKNQQEPSIEIMKNICKALNIKLIDLLEENSSKISFSSLRDYTTEELLKELLRREKTNE